MAINYPLSSTHCHNGTGFMPWYKLSRRDCATVTHLYKLSPNTEPQHAMRTVMNIVERIVHQRKVCARRTALWGDVLQANRTLTFQVLCSNPLLTDFKLQWQRSFIFCSSHYQEISDL